MHGLASLKGPGRWETDCGRYENQNYPVGNAIDPQTCGKKSPTMS